MGQDRFGEIGPARAGVADHQLEPRLDRIAAAVMKATGGFDKKNCAARIAEFDDFLPIHDRVNIFIAHAIAALSVPIVQGPAGLLRNTARQKCPRAVFDRRVPQEHEDVNVRQRVIVNVIKLAVVRFFGLIVENGIGFNEPNS